MRPGLTPLLLLAALFTTAAAAAADAQTRPARGATTRPAGEIRRGVVMGGSPEERGRRSMERIAGQIEPSLRGDVSRLSTYIAFAKRQFVQDLRTFAFDAAAEAKPDGTIVVTGYAEYPEHIDAVTNFLTFLGFDKVDNRIKRLPDEALGDKRFGLVRSARAGLYDKTAAPREHVTEALLGDPLFLLMESDGHYLCHSAEGYVGYVSAEDVVRVTAAELSESQRLPRATVRQTTTSGPATLPAGAHFRVTSTDSQSVVVSVPGAGDLAVPAAAVTVVDEQAALARVTPVLDAARGFMGTPYVWGGKTLDGIDCSGLVQTSFQTQNVRLPRDADQQGYVGQLVATRWHRQGLRAGDTLYFLSRSGRINHTAIYLGNHHYIEAAGPGVKITSFDPASPNYDERRDKSFCFAKRIMD